MTRTEKNFGVGVVAQGRKRFSNFEESGFLLFFFDAITVQVRTVISVFYSFEHEAVTFAMYCN